MIRSSLEIVNSIGPETEVDMKFKRVDKKLSREIRISSETEKVLRSQKEILRHLLRFANEKKQFEPIYFL